jgi:hypothetical protein
MLQQQAVYHHTLEQAYKVFLAGQLHLLFQMPMDVRMISQQLLTSQQSF